VKKDGCSEMSGIHFQSARQAEGNYEARLQVEARPATNFAEKTISPRANKDANRTQPDLGSPALTISKASHLQIDIVIVHLLVRSIYGEVSVCRPRYLAP